MRLTKNAFGKTYLLMWRTESIFFNQERRRLSEEWNMVRFTSLPYPSEPNLANSSLKVPLPYPDNSFEAIYSFHVFEHLTYDEGLYALSEMYRVMKPGGVCRISTPDLLFFSREYIKQVELSEENEEYNIKDFKYNWALLNLIDQAVRRKSGGRMIEAILAPNIDLNYLKHLNGDSLTFMLDSNLAGQLTDSVKKPTYFNGRAAPLSFRLKKLGFGVLRKIILKFSALPAIEINNERNRWLYDHISLSGLYTQTGFHEVVVQDFKTSSIEGWDRYNYDGSIFGDYPLEPSLYVEGKK